VQLISGAGLRSTAKAIARQIPSINALIAQRDALITENAALRQEVGRLSSPNEALRPAGTELNTLAETYYGESMPLIPRDAAIETVQSTLFFTPYGEWRVHNQVDVTVAAALRARNCQVHFVTCDGLYKPCAITLGEQDCVRCKKAMGDLFAPYGFFSSTLGSLITLSDNRRADAWVAGLADEELATACFEDLRIGEWALSTVMTHFRISLVQQVVNPRIVSVYRHFLRDTLLTYWAIDRVLERERYDAIVLFNARIYPYRAAFEAAQRRGLRILVHERGRIGNSFAFFEGESCLGPGTLHRLNDAWSEVPLQESEIRQLDEYFLELLHGRNTSWPPFYRSVRHFDARSVLDIPDNARLIGFFTSSADEMAHLERFGGGKRQFELIETVAQVLEGTDTYLVVRHHPYIAGASNCPVEVTGFDAAYLQTLDRHENVRIIMPSDSLTSYSLFPKLTAAIAPYSSIAMELLAFGVPTLVSNISDAAFDERFVLKDWSAPAMAAAIDFIKSRQAHLQVDDLRRFYRKCYNGLFRFSVAFNVVGIKDYFDVARTAATADELLPGQDPALDRICEHILVGRRAHEYPCDRDHLPSRAAEDRYIKGQLDIFDSRRREREAQAVESGPVQPPIDSFAIVIDETTKGHLESSVWQRLPNARTLSIKNLTSQDLEGWLKGALVFLRSRKSNRDFVAWALGIRRLLKKTTEDYVLVTNRRFQFHDTSIAVISEAVNLAAEPGQKVIALSGWLRDPDQFFPLRVQPINGQTEYWRDVRVRLGGSLRPQHTLALFVVRRDWLTERLTEWVKLKKSADEFEDALLGAVAVNGTEVAVAQPVFLLR
jgi:hypothetical protein